MATTLKIGDKAPIFIGINEKEETIKLADFKGNKLVLYFYPHDNTPTCTEEACNLRDNYHSFLAKGYSILGVSEDSVKKHQNFIKKYELPFSLLADTDHVIQNLYGVWGEKTMYGKKYMGTIRITFIIDEKGKIEDIIEKVEAKNHSAQILG